MISNPLGINIIFPSGDLSAKERKKAQSVEQQQDCKAPAFRSILADF